ncbi:hypothetical protein [Polaromonas sp.]|uniref:hypothetical protein n=1 Tax=Polaromonas sp. TaxID=1869339 RepID=UPI0013B63DE7|nr:hypothetical protein [Polaromonas sp.]NDP64646.1 hypothetical protein [Polaromonas sp.]
MATTQTKRELFEASEYLKKMDQMIANLRTKKPGELAGKVGKNEILTMRREALQQLVKDGYTIQQIADAMKDDVFGILPKSITQVINNKKKKARAAKPVNDEVSKEAVRANSKSDAHSETAKSGIEPSNSYKPHKQVTKIEEAE